MSQTKGQTCKERVDSHYASRMADLRAMWKAECEGNEDGPEDTGPLNEYGLSFDYVALGTFPGQHRGYWRYQLSWGGPSDEFRFYCDESRNPVRVEYWFLDWFDGARRTISKGGDFAFLLELWDWFKDGGTVDHVYEKAHEDEQ